MSGSDQALHQLLDHMRNGARWRFWASSPGTPDRLERGHLQGLTLQGVYGRKMYETWYKMAAMVESGLDLTPLITHRFHFSDFEQGFAAMNTGHSGR
jgi:threonine 3-dehydrogenase